MPKSKFSNFLLNKGGFTQSSAGESTVNVSFLNAKEPVEMGSIKENIEKYFEGLECLKSIVLVKDTIASGVAFLKTGGILNIQVCFAHRETDTELKIVTTVTKT